jgi:hypothetical protein
LVRSGINEASGVKVSRVAKQIGRSGKYDGTPVTVTGEEVTWDTVAIKQVNAKTLTEERTKLGGKYHTTVRTVVSADGKTLTSTTEGTGADGKSTSALAVFDKQ